MKKEEVKKKIRAKCSECNERATSYFKTKPYCPKHYPKKIKMSRGGRKPSSFIIL